MKQMLSAVFAILFVIPNAANAQGFLGGGISGAAGALSEMAEAQMRANAQREAIQQQHQLEMERLDRQMQYERARREQSAAEMRNQSLMSQLQSEVRTQRDYIKTLEAKVERLTQYNNSMTEAYHSFRVYEKYPLWRETIKAKQFSSWLYQKPQDVQSLARSPHSDDAIKLLDLYQSEVISKQRKM